MSVREKLANRAEEADLIVSVPAGEHKVTITKTDRPVFTPKSDGSVADTGDEPEEEQAAQGRENDSEPKNLLPEKYARPETSGLTATVSETGENKFDFTIE